jgi:preprotein translocase subunit YajC
VTALASTLAAQQSSGSPFGLLIILVPFGLLIWLMVVPQRKQRARQQELISKLDVGDEVITSGGIVGVITHVEDQIVHLEVDHDVVIRVSKPSITRTLAEPDPATASRSRGGMLGGLLGGGAAASSDEATSNGSTATKGTAKKK